MVVNEINQLRKDLRNEKKYDVSDSLRNILENADIQVKIVKSLNISFWIMSKNLKFF